MYIGTLLLSTKTHIYASVKHRLFCFCTLQVLLKVDGKANKLHVTSGTVLGSSYAYRQDTYRVWVGDFPYMQKEWHNIGTFKTYIFKTNYITKR